MPERRAQPLKKAVAERAERRNLTITLDKMRYALEHWIGLVEDKQRALSVGCGNGHRICLMGLEYGFSSIVGVDPYIASDGSSSEDYQKLLDLIAELGLFGRIEIVKKTAQDYLTDMRDNAKFSLVMINDALHYMYKTKKLLHEDAVCYSNFVGFLADLRKVMNDGSLLMIEEVKRDRLRSMLPMFRKMDYSTKQPAREWKTALEDAGFYILRTVTYLPYLFRKFRILIDNPLGRILCSRYFIICRK
ncbi:MAG: methyltransferase domain-containing protein [Elusimicrobia bacterium]|nr:methyltransferase domain-containing protein [Elusimicrobiota bacterium]